LGAAGRALAGRRCLATGLGIAPHYADAEDQLLALGEDSGAGSAAGASGRA